MALTTSYLVRTEFEATRNRIEAEQSYFVARGGIEAAIYSILRSTSTPPPLPGTAAPTPEFVSGQRWLRYEFPGGHCDVEVVPENAKLGINSTPPEQLAILFQTLGLSVMDSTQLAAAIVDWRRRHCGR